MREETEISSLTPEEKAGLLPDSPGVYMMRDAKGEIIYVGKASNLRRRVRSYFGSAVDSRYQVKFLMAKATDIEVMLTDTEKEALLLENTLIKRHRPRYNLDLKDDKTYFSIRLDRKEKFPRFTIIRKVPEDGARYFGPYSSASAAREVLRRMQRIFPLRHHSLARCMTRSRPCLYHQIGQCCAPCRGDVSEKDYSDIVDGATLFLEGKNRLLISLFRKKMLDASKELRFEEAAGWRNLLRSIEITVEKQNMVARGGDCDIIGFCRREKRMQLTLLSVRDGAMTGSHHFTLKWELDDREGVSSFLSQYYFGHKAIPEEIFLPLQIVDTTALEEYLSELRGESVSIKCPKKGRGRELVELAARNAEAAMIEREAREESSSSILEELRKNLRLSRTPRRIECYDISNIQGRFAVGSGVTFTDALPDKKLYRRYRIREVEGQDDFAMLSEVFYRRFNEEKVKRDGFPDMVVVDGGIGQLNAALAVVRELGIEERFDLVSLAKSRTGSDHASPLVTRSDERVFIPGRRNPVTLRQNSPPLLLLARIRDEAHRFAIEYHRNLRSKGGITSALAEIPGIGPKRLKALLSHFGSLQNLKQADGNEIASVEGMTERSTRAIIEWLGRNDTGVSISSRGEEGAGRDSAR